MISVVVDSVEEEKRRVVAVGEMLLGVVKIVAGLIEIELGDEFKVLIEENWAVVDFEGTYLNKDESSGVSCFFCVFPE